MRSLHITFWKQQNHIPVKNAELKALPAAILTAVRIVDYSEQLTAQINWYKEPWQMLIFFIFSVPHSKHLSVDCNGGGRGETKITHFKNTSERLQSGPINQ